MYPTLDGSVFLAHEQPGPTDVGAAVGSGEVETGLASGQSLRCRGGIGDADLARLIRLVEAA